MFCRTDPISELYNCIEHVNRGEIWAGRDQARYLLDALRNTPCCDGIEDGKLRLLTKRELEVAEHAAQGQGNKQIANELNLTMALIEQQKQQLEPARYAQFLKDSEKVVLYRVFADPHPKGVVLDREVATLQMENFPALLQGYHSIALSDNPTRRSQARVSALPSERR